MATMNMFEMMVYGLDLLHDRLFAHIFAKQIKVVTHAAIYINIRTLF